MKADATCSFEGDILEFITWRGEIPAIFEEGKVDCLGRMDRKGKGQKYVCDQRAIF